MASAQGMSLEVPPPGRPPSAALSPTLPLSPRAATEPREWADVLRDFYQEHNPAKIPTIPTFLERYKGREFEIPAKLESLKAEYKKEKEARRTLKRAQNRSSLNEEQRSTWTGSTPGTASEKRVLLTFEPPTPLDADRHRPQRVAPGAPDGVEPLHRVPTQAQIGKSEPNRDNVVRAFRALDAKGMGRIRAGDLLAQLRSPSGQQLRSFLSMKPAGDPVERALEGDPSKFVDADDLLTIAARARGGGVPTVATPSLTTPVARASPLEEPSGGEGAGAQVPFVVDDRTLDSLILGHFKAMGLRDAATAFEAETGAKHNESFEDEGGSALQLLFARRSTTEACIRVLLADTRERLRASAHHYFDRDTMDALDAMAHEPIWSPSRRVFTRKSADSGGSIAEIARLDAATLGTLHAAALNQLVERMTKITIKPHVSQKKEERHAEEEFTLSFLRTYKLFCSPHVLLAKLFQRWYLPLGLPLTDHYSDHYIFINSHMPRTSAKWWDSVSAKLKCRVASVLLSWIEQFPGDWDATMVECVELFIDDNFYEPSLDRPRVPTELLQFSSLLKCSLARLVYRAESERVEPNDSESEEEADDGQVQGVHLLALSPETLAEQITAADQRFLRKIKVRELLDFTKNEMHFMFLDAQGEGTTLFGPEEGRSQYLSSPGSRAGSPLYGDHSPSPSPYGAFGAFHQGGATAQTKARQVAPRKMGSMKRARNLATFLKRSTAIEGWITAEVLTAADDDERRAKCDRLINLAFRLIERNNFASARAVVMGLTHPGITRLSHFLDTVEFWPSLTRLSNTLVDTSPFCTSYKRLLASLTEAEKREYPPIPWLGCWVNELHLVDEAEPTVLVEDRSGYIHWRKYQVISDIYKRFSALQEFHFATRIPTDAVVQRYLRSSFELSRQFDWPALLQLSMQHAPPFPAELHTPAIIPGEAGPRDVRPLKALPPGSP
eukprot:Hpha_TRINITY_DN11875_c0_g2::TRINITY_DN11875_c0_g2_i1::g.1978::m.1978